MQDEPAAAAAGSSRVPPTSVLRLLRSLRHRLPVLARAAGLLGLLAALAPAAAAPADAATAPAGFRPFAPDSIWNLPLRRDVPLSPRSDEHVRWLTSIVAARGGYINTTSCGMPLFWADPDTPRVRVVLDHPSYMDPGLVRAWSSVPIPAGAAPARCADRNFAVAQVQPDGTIREWEFHGATRDESGQWTATWGGAIDDVMADRGIASGLAWRDPLAPVFLARRSSPGWHVTASSVSMLAGVVTLEEIARRRIDHALAMATTDAAKGRFMWPAQRTDGGLTDPAALPEGARLRIDPDLDLDGLNLTPMVRMLAEAAQRYGIVVRDRTHDANVFYTQEPPPGEPNPVTPLLDGLYTGTALKAFPWERLQVLDAPLCSDFRGCTITSRASIEPEPARPTPGSSVTLDTSNSMLEHPRTRVDWDLDGDGAFETAGGTGVTRRMSAGPAGRRTVGVRMVLRDGQVVEGSRTFEVGEPRPDPAPGARPAVTVTLDPPPPPQAEPAPAAAGPAPAGAPSGPGAGAGAPAGPAAALPRVTVARRLAVSSSGSRLRLALACARPAACAGRARVTLARPLRTRSGTLAAGTPLGTARFTVAAGGRRTLSLRIGPRAARILRRAKVRSLALRGPAARRLGASGVQVAAVPEGARPGG